MLARRQRQLISSPDFLRGGRAQESNALGEVIKHGLCPFAKAARAQTRLVTSCAGADESAVLQSIKAELAALRALDPAEPGAKDADSSPTDDEFINFHKLFD